MSDDADEIETIYSDAELATASYGSHTAELAQAFGNLLAQAMRMPADHHFVPITLAMLEKVAASVEINPKGSLRAVKGGKAE